MDLELTTGPDRDLVLDDVTGDLRLVSGRRAVVQHLKTRLRFFKGEWFLDRRLGVSYFDRVLGHTPTRPEVTKLVRDVVRSTPGVRSVWDIDVRATDDPRSRALVVSFTARLSEEDEALEFVEEVVI